MKTIDSIIKKKKVLTISFSGEIQDILAEVALKYHLALGQEITEDTYHALIMDHLYQTYYEMAIKKLKQMQTTHEMKVFLTSKGAPSSIIKQIISKLKERKYIDDALYIKTYLQFKAQTYGPKMLAYKLKQKGLDHVAVDQAISAMDQSDTIEMLIQKKLNTLKSKSNQQKIQLIKAHLLNKGFELSAIESYVNHLQLSDDQELKTLKLTYDKLLYKYRDLAGYEQQEKIISKLMTLGFRYDLIKKVVK